MAYSYGHVVKTRAWVIRVNGSDSLDRYGHFKTLKAAQKAALNRNYDRFANVSIWRLDVERVEKRSAHISRAQTMKIVSAVQVVADAHPQAVA